MSSNPQVFPITDNVHLAGRVVPVMRDGLTLRDLLAGQALSGLLADPTVRGDMAEIARRAYKIADAMLKAREET